jgi:hypothetical protein
VNRLFFRPAFAYALPLLLLLLRLLALIILLLVLLPMLFCTSRFALLQHAS